MTVPELEAYFKSITLPESIQLGQAVKISNVQNFVDGHLAILKNYGDSPSFRGFYDRLIILKEKLAEL